MRTGSGARVLCDGLQAKFGNVWRVIGDVPHEKPLILVVERHTPVDEAKERHTKRPEVDLWANLGLINVQISVTQLWRVESGSANSFGKFDGFIDGLSVRLGLVPTGIVRATASPEVGNAEVRYLDAVVLSHEQIGRFYVAVYDVLVV
jgi:hypothetical protein